MPRHRLSGRNPVASVVLHWALVAALVASFLTGMRIAADAAGASVTRALEPVLPQGNVFEWHLMAAIAMVSLAAAYLAYLLHSGLVARYRPARLARGGRWKRVNLLVYWLLFTLFFVSLGSGMVIYLLPAWGGLGWVEAAHRAAAWGFAGGVLLHVLGQFMAGGWSRLARIFLPRPVLLGAGALAAATGAAAGVALYAVERSSLPTLRVERVAAPPEVDGRPDDPVWVRVAPRRIHTANGANLPGGMAEVRVQAVHDGEYAYFLFQWPDVSRSLKHAPLVKTEQGWKVLQTGFGRADENVFYEDKFAVLISREGGPAGDGSIHLGSAPLSGHPGPSGGRGLHFTVDGGFIDLWHWKAVRTNPFHQADDNFFGPPEPMMPLSAGERARKEAGGFPRARYTGGYRKDPISWSSYEMNWEAFSPGVVEPRRLPVDDDFLERLPEPDLTPGVSDSGRWWIDFEDTDDYTPVHDHYPVGTVMPSVLLHGPLQGDRGDVTARGTWEEGHWRLEVRRRLDTGSRFDVPIEDGVYMWVGVFDRTQTRHSYHPRPLKVSLAP